MEWGPLQSRAIKVDWARSLSNARIDPYLMWADATRFAGFAENVPDRIAIAFEVDPKAEGLAALGKPFTSPLVDGEAVEIGSRFGVASVRTLGLSWLLDPAVQRLIPRFEIGMPLGGAARGLRSGLLRSELDQFDLGGADAPVAAVIDDGCPFAHMAFRTRKGKRWRTRIAALWFQEDRTQFGFSGSELDNYINRSAQLGVVDERACYSSLRDDLRHRLPTPSLADGWWHRMMGPATHGAHVLDIFAGSPNPLAKRYRIGSVGDRAEQARIVFVQLPRSSIDDTSGLSMNVCVLEALVYLAARVKGRQTVVNLSYGSLAGPHDGSSLLESAMDHFLDKHRNFAIVLPAGNGYDYLTHASVVAAPDACWHNMPLHILPDDPTDTFIELWYELQPATGARAILDFELIAPDGSCSGPVACDTAIEAHSPGADLPTAAVVHQSRPPTAAGSSKYSVLVALSASRPTLRERPAAAHGVWTVRVRNRGGLAVTVNAWIERDDSAFGSGRSRTQAVFLSQGMGAAPGDPHSATSPIDRRACLNSIAHGARPVVVGGSVLRPRQMASYSASGPGRRGSLPGPNYVAPCEETPGIGLLAAGTRSGSLVHMNGTSTAAPIAARDLLNRSARDRAPPNVDPDALMPPSSEKAGHPMPDPRLRRGLGLLLPFTSAEANGKSPTRAIRPRRARAP